MKSSFARLLPLLFLTSASATSIPNSGLSSQEITATYDDVKVVPAAGELQPVNVYKGLSYPTFNFLQAGVGGIVVTGVVPESGSNTVATGLIGQLQKGTPTITVKYDGSKSKFFDLESFFFGCVANSVETITGLPEICTISVTGFLPGSNTAVDSINYSFYPGKNVVRAEMVPAVLPSTFKGLERVEIVVVEATATEAGTGLLIDNTKYKLFTAK